MTASPPDTLHSILPTAVLCLHSEPSRGNKRSGTELRSPLLDASCCERGWPGAGAQRGSRQRAAVTRAMGCATTTERGAHPPCSLHPPARSAKGPARTARPPPRPPAPRAAPRPGPGGPPRCQRGRPCAGRTGRRHRLLLLLLLPGTPPPSLLRRSWRSVLPLASRSLWLRRWLGRWVCCRRGPSAGVRPRVPARRR